MKKQYTGNKGEKYIRCLTVDEKLFKMTLKRQQGEQIISVDYCISIKQLYNKK